MRENLTFVEKENNLVETLQEVLVVITEILKRKSHKNTVNEKHLMQGKSFQKCTHLLYCSVLSLGGNVNTRQMLQPDMGSIFHIKNQWNILVIGNYCVNYQNYQNLMPLTSSDTKRTLMHLFLFTNSAQENWFQYVRRVYTTAINFPCITPLGIHTSVFLYTILQNQQLKIFSFWEIINIDYLIHTR